MKYKVVRGYVRIQDTIYRRGDTFEADEKEVLDSIRKRSIAPETEPEQKKPRVKVVQNEL